MSNSSIQPYVFFGGRCEEAIEFYKNAVGAKVDQIMYFKDSPDPAPPGMVPPGFENKVMHASFQVGGSTVMVSDGCDEGQNHEGFSLAYVTSSVDEAERAFTALSDGGEIQMPIGKTFWSPAYGMLTDRFGIAWMVSTTPEEQA